MERLRRRPEPAAIDITWVSCRGVRSSLPFHKPCLYASVSVVSSGAGRNARPHRVKTATDRADGENPEWDAPLRLYVPGVSPPAAEPEAAEKKTKGRLGSGSGGEDVLLLVRFEIKAEVAVLGDVLAASAAVPVPELVADGQTRRVSYQLAGPDGRQRNGVVSFSYVFHGTNDIDDDSHSSDGELVATPTSSCSAACSAVALPPPAATTAAPRLYPAMEWALAEQIPIYPPPVTATANGPVVTAIYPPPPQQVGPAAVYPPLPKTSSSCSVYSPTIVEPAASALYPAVDLAPVSYYPPAPPPSSLYDAGYGYAAAPGWDHRCLYG